MKTIFVMIWISVLCWIYILWSYTNKQSNQPESNMCVFSEYDLSKRLAILVPYRDRAEHLTTFINVMHSFLNNIGVNYQIIVIEQIGGRAFNRGMLFNAGYSMENKNYDYFCFHDVDMIPAELCIDYSFPENKARHLAVNVQQFNFTEKKLFIQWRKFAILWWSNVH